MAGIPAEKVIEKLKEQIAQLHFELAMAQAQNDVFQSQIVALESGTDNPQ